MLSTSGGKQILCEQIASFSSVGRLVMASGSVYLVFNEVGLILPFSRSQEMHRTKYV